MCLEWSCGVGTWPNRFFSEMSRKFILLPSWVMFLWVFFVVVVDFFWREKSKTIRVTVQNNIIGIGNICMHGRIVRICIFCGILVRIFYYLNLVYLDNVICLWNLWNVYEVKSLTPMWRWSLWQLLFLLFFNYLIKSYLI